MAKEKVVNKKRQVRKKVRTTASPKASLRTRQSRVNGKKQGRDVKMTNSMNRINKQQDAPVLLDVDDLSVNYWTSHGILRAVKDISFQIKKGTITSIVGESGSGKSSTAFAIVGMLPHATGNVKINNYIVPASSRFITKKFQRYLARTMQFIFQDPFTSINPRARVYSVLKEPLRVNNPRMIKIKEENAKMKHQINIQLVKLAEKIAKKPLKHLRKLTMDLYRTREKVVKELMQQYEIDEYKIRNSIAEIWQIKNSFRTRIQTFVEKKQAEQKLFQGSDEELKELISKHNQEFDEYVANLKKQRNKEIAEFKEEVAEEKLQLKEDKAVIKEHLKNISLKNKELDEKLSEVFDSAKGLKRINTNVFKHRYPVTINEKLAKSVTGLRYYLKLFQDFLGGGFLDAIEYRLVVGAVHKSVHYNLRSAKIIASIINKYFAKYSRIATKYATETKIQNRLVQVGLNPEDIVRYPKDFSGGQRQRIAIARAMMSNPSLLIADEPISSLDVSIQAQIINLIKDLKEKHDLTVLFIAHDLRMVEFLSDNIIVMSKGQIVESGTTKEIFDNPTHPYTRALFSAIPSIDSINKKMDVLDYDDSIYQNPYENLKEYSLSPTHKVLSTDKWIKEWKAAGKEFVVYKDTTV